MAVGSADQCVYVYSLPYGDDDQKSVYFNLPRLVCKVKIGKIFFDQNHLLQVLRVSWFVKNNQETLLAAGYINGLVSVWNVSNSSLDDELSSMPMHLIQAHKESITALDFKRTNGNEFHLLTGSLDRNIKVFTFDDHRFQETSSHYAVSRILWAEWWLHWPSCIIGFDDCFSFGSIVHRQPMDFGMRNRSLLKISNTSIVHFSINHWLNFVMFSTESGDILGCSPGQMLDKRLSNRAFNQWSNHNFNFVSSTGCSDILKDGKKEIGTVFSDFKVRSTVFPA